MQDEIKAMYARTFKEKHEIHNNKRNEQNMDIKKKLINNKENPKFITKAVDMKKSIIMREKINNRNNQKQNRIEQDQKHKR